MVDKQFEAEKFRAQIHLFLGMSFSTPSGLMVLEFTKDGKEFTVGTWLFALASVLVGYLLINNSYIIMYKQGFEGNAKFYSR